MNTKISVKIGMGLIRVFGIAIGAGHVFGYLRFHSDHSFFMVVPAVALLILSIAPVRWIAQRSWLIWAVGGVTGLAYAWIGLPFLDSANDAGARAIWLVEFILIIFLGSIPVVRAVRRIREALPLQMRVLCADQYNYFRDYDPAIGRYLESDPLGLRVATNTYLYVDGSPLASFDLFGLANSGPWPRPKSCPRGKCEEKCFVESQLFCFPFATAGGVVLGGMIAAVIGLCAQPELVVPTFYVVSFIGGRAVGGACTELFMTKCTAACPLPCTK